MKDYITHEIKLNLNKMGIYSGLTDKLWLKEEAIKHEFTFLDEKDQKKHISGFIIDKPKMLTHISKLFEEYFNENTSSTWKAKETSYDDNGKLIDEIILATKVEDFKIIKELEIIEDKIKEIGPKKFEEREVYRLKTGYAILQNYIHWVMEVDEIDLFLYDADHNKLIKETHRFYERIQPYAFSKNDQPLYLTTEDLYMDTIWHHTDKYPLIIPIPKNNILLFEIKAKDIEVGNTKIEKDKIKNHQELYRKLMDEMLELI